MCSPRDLTVAYDELAVTGLEAMPMVFLDPPAHTAFRRLVTGPLTPRTVATIVPAVSPTWPLFPVGPRW